MKATVSTMRTWTARGLAYAVALHGLAILALTLVEQFEHLGRRGMHLSGLFLEVPILLGMSLLYLSTLLRRSKRTAWMAALALYVVLLLINIPKILALHAAYSTSAELLLRDFGLPLLLIGALIYARDSFRVKSDVRSFAVSLRFVALALFVAFLYGVTGFTLMDQRDFHQEIGPVEAAHRTIDQFDFTTSGAITPHSRRAHLFLDSLSVVSTGAVAYAALSLFQPLRARLADQAQNRASARKLLETHSADSEDYFKLWPEDKNYFFDDAGKCGLAYQVRSGVALVVGDPFGDTKRFSKLLQDFGELCYVNDWQPAFIHTHPRFSKLYKSRGYGLQKIGEEAVIDITAFNEKVRRNKYFRNVFNRFTKNGYSVEQLKPPHSAAVLLRLQEITNDWLEQPGRAERGFMMGYFSDDYFQQCDLFVVKDDAGTIRGFINQIPSYDPEEANYDMLRSTSNSQSNTNDFLLLGFLEYLGKQGYKRLNIGLCPLVGMDDTNDANKVIDRALRFLYANGDRLYSFSGLYRFKAKYEPNWSGRYIAYKGGVRGFTRILTALNRATRIRSSKTNKKAK